MSLVSTQDASITASTVPSKPALQSVPQPLLLRMEDAAVMLSVSRSQIYALAATKQIPTVRLGKSVRVPYDALTAWVDEKVALASGEGRN